jgi:hypothetical protein
MEPPEPIGAGPRAALHLDGDDIFPALEEKIDFRGGRFARGGVRRRFLNMRMMSSYFAEI